MLVRSGHRWLVVAGLPRRGPGTDSTQTTTRFRYTGPVRKWRRKVLPVKLEVGRDY